MQYREFRTPKAMDKIKNLYIKMYVELKMGKSPCHFGDDKWLKFSLNLCSP
jgi:hypothetical protein